MDKNTGVFSEIQGLREHLITRDYLAIERTKLANERTLFSYLRTSLYLVTVGVGVWQVTHKPRFYILAWICITVGIIIFCIGGVRYTQLSRQLKKVSAFPPKDPAAAGAQADPVPLSTDL